MFFLNETHDEDNDSFKTSIQDPDDEVNIEEKPEILIKIQ